MLGGGGPQAGLRSVATPVGLWALQPSPGGRWPPRGRKRGGTRSDPAPPHTRQGFALPPSRKERVFPLVRLGYAEPP